ncbi:carbon storage regulator [Vibrio scophthalmi]|uniref:carbon storage regulator n=1 Tax=Vibrio scophthalmi TaxID=45658 RepID=UPI002FF26797
MRTALFVLMTLGTLSAYADELILEQPGLSEQQLDSSRGGQYHIDIESVTASSEINGINAGNAVTNSVTGNNVIASSALMHSSGITSVVQNTGNNVLIQNSTVVNLTLK